VAEVFLPTPLLPLFPELTRHVEVDAPTVADAIAQLNERWPGFRDRLVEAGPALRPHIMVFVDKERGGLDSPLEASSRVDVIAAISGG
jgi:molybdopterin converting factor small subunit